MCQSSSSSSSWKGGLISWRLAPLSCSPIRQSESLRRLLTRDQGVNDNDKKEYDEDEDDEDEEDDEEHNNQRV